ncbi:hypothetical protein ACFV4N_37095 [Actinosynnema sp. NPDC059797]
MTNAPTDRREQLVALLTVHAMTDEQAREHDHPLIRAQARMEPQNRRVADMWLLNRLTVRHRELGWRGTPPTYTEVLAYRAEQAEAARESESA